MKSISTRGIRLAATLALCVPAALRAQGEERDSTAVLPERPTVATHAYVIKPGFVEVETGVTAFRPTDDGTFDVPNTIKFGLTRWLQLAISPGFTSNRGGPGGDLQVGFGDLSVAAKLVVGTGLPVLADFAVKPSLKLATGSTSRGFGTGTTEGGILLVSSRQVLGGQIDANAGITFSSGDGTDAPETSTVWAVAGSRSIAGPLGAVAEVFGFPGTSGPAGGPPQVGLLFGPTWALRPSLVLDAGAIVNVRHLGGNAAYVGLTANLGRWFGR
ncbi:MAG: transporter [Longimicrobiaceae bacterium]